MSTGNQPAPNPTWMSFVGWIITLLPALGLIASGALKLILSGALKWINFKPEGVPDVGWPESALFGLGIVEIGCAILYLLPRTAVVGAVLVTGYLGGAVAHHVRGADGMFPVPILLGLLVWLGLLFRDPRLRAVLPWKSDVSAPATGGVLAALGKIIFGLVVIVLLIAGLIEAQPEEYRISRSTTIDAPPEKVFEQVNDFHKWDWNPWLDYDPKVKVTVEGAPGKDAVYKWSGEKIGEGMMTLTESQPNELLKIKLQFIKPFEEGADAEFTFKAKDEKTEITWTVSGQRETLFKARDLVNPLVAKQFENGLAKLKKKVEGESKK